MMLYCNDMQNVENKSVEVRKEISQKLIESLHNEIAHLQSEIEFLRGLVKKQMPD